MPKIRGILHVWFDFHDTIASADRGVLEDIAHAAYAEVLDRQVGPELIAEYKELLARHKSNSAIFTSLGKPAGFLSDRVGNRADLYRLTDEHIPEVLERLRALVPVSIFSNSRLEKILPSLGIAPEWFTHILGPDRVARPKPALDGFHKMIKLSDVPASEILYVADSVEKDLLPAKQANIKTGLLWKNSPEADYCFEDFRDILASFE